MSIVTLVDAKRHLRVTHDAEDALIQTHLDAAEKVASEWMGRAILGTPEALALARAGVPAQVAAAAEAHTSAIEAAGALGSDVEILIAVEAAERDYRQAQAQARMVHAGVLVDAAIEAAVLLVVGELYADREGADIPRGAQSLLQSYKLYG